MMLASEMEKLGIYAGTAPVREADVRELVSRASEQKGYFLADAVAEGQGATAARVLQEMLEDGQPTSVILSTVAGRYRRIALVKEMMENRASRAEVARRLGIKEFSAERLIEQASHTSWPAVRAAYARLIEAELDLKRGLMDDPLPLELAVQELAARPR
jgi:DNA polymerase III delta subunit